MTVIDSGANNTIILNGRPSSAVYKADASGDVVMLKGIYTGGEVARDVYSAWTIKGAVPSSAQEAVELLSAFVGNFKSPGSGGGSGTGGSAVETDPVAMAKLNSMFDTNGQLLPQYLPPGVTTPTQLVPEQPTSPEANTLYIFPNADGQYQTQFYDGTIWHVVGDFTSVTDLTNYLTSDEIAAAYAPMNLLVSVANQSASTTVNLSQHTNTDANRWNYVYTFEGNIIDSVINAKGMRRDTDNVVSITAPDYSYAVTNALGGLLTVTVNNTPTNTMQSVNINGVQVYLSNGLAIGIPFTLYFPVADGDYIQVNGVQSATFTPYIADPGSSQQQMLATITQLSGRVGSLQSQINDLSASLANKTVAGVTPIDITNQSYTVNNALGARITGQGAQVLGLLGITVAATGTVSVNGTQVYNNTALLSGTPEVLSINVDDGAVISSSGMQYVSVYNYVAGSN